MRLEKASLVGDSFKNLVLPSASPKENALSVSNGRPSFYKGEFVSLPDRLKQFGPGAQSLIQGNTEAGYFGRISSNEFITSDQFVLEVEQQLGFAEHYGAYVTAEWLKFQHQNRVLIVPKSPVAVGLNIVKLYDAGLIYRVDGVGQKTNDSPSFVNQLRYITIGEYVYKLGLLSSTEWQELLIRTSASYGDWDNLSDAEMVFSSGGISGKYQWIQGLQFGQHLWRGNNSVVGSGYGYSSSNTGSRNGWRPVLELVQ